MNGAAQQVVAALDAARLAAATPTPSFGPPGVPAASVTPVVAIPRG